MSKNSKRQCKIIGSFLAVFIQVFGASAGVLTVTTTPAYDVSKTGEPKTKFIVLPTVPLISEEDESRNINFSCTATPDEGEVTEYLWNFGSDATPKTSDQQNPGVVTFSPEALTKVTTVTVGVTHKIGEVFCAVKDSPVTTILLLPLDIQVHQTKNGPQGSPPKYIDAPKDYIASNLFSLWPNEEAIVKVKIAAPMSKAEDLPADFIKWVVPSHEIPSNTLEATLKWNLGFSNNTKEVKITVGTEEFILHFKVQGVGQISQADAALLVPNAASVMLGYRQEAIDFGNSYPEGPQRDAMRHSYWCSLAVSTYGVTSADVLIFATAHEYDNRYSQKQQAFNSTMDIQNNSIGASTNHQDEGLPNRVAIVTDLNQNYGAGEMFIWEVPQGAASRNEQHSEGILIKSNGSRIYQ